MKRKQRKQGKQAAGTWGTAAAVLGGIAAFWTLQSFGADLVRYLRIRSM